MTDTDRPTDHCLAGPSRRGFGRAVAGLSAAGLAAHLLPVRPAAAQTPAPPLAPEAFRTLRAAPLRAKLTPDATAEAELWAFDGSVVPPTIRVRHGEEVRVRLQNDCPADLTLHWHGVRNAAAADGVGGLTQPPVRPGERFEYRFTPPDPGTALARSLVPGRTGEAAGRGLAAVLVVEEREPIPVDADHVLLVRDWALLPDGALRPFGDPRESALAGRLGSRMAVAGADAPHRIALPPGSRVRLRLLNGCNARIARIRFDGLRAFVAAVDGQPTGTFEPLRSSLPFPPGSRYDVILDVPAGPDGKGAVTALVGPGIPLVEVVATDAPPVGAGRPAPSSPAANPRLPAEIRLQAATRREVVIAGGATRGTDGQPVFPAAGGPTWTVDGAPGRLDGRPLVSVRRGTPLVLGLVNRTGFPQPLHIHGHVVRQLHPLDDGWEPYWLDTVQVPDGKTVHVAFLADNPGRWMIGSTVLERLDAGLWTWFEVT